MKRIFTLINLVLIFFIVNFFISGLYEHFSREFDLDDYSKAVDRNEQRIEKKSFQNQSHYKTVGRRDLFKTEKIDKLKNNQPEKQVSASAKKIQVTELELELKGTITGTGSDPFAVIKKKKEKKGMLYATGDIVDRAVIKAIFRERVILLVDGREEILLMVKSKSKNDSNKESSNNGVGITAGKSKDGIIENILLTWADVNILSKDLKTLRKQVRVRPHFYKGVMDGFRVTGIKKKSVFYKKLGFKNGDIVTAVNEKEMKSVKDVMNFYDMFKELDGNVAMEVDIKRKGSPGKIRYSIE